MLIERTEEDRVEIVGPFRHIQIRTAMIIERDGVEISRSFSRKVLAPDADTNGESDLVRGVVGVAWTPELRNAWGQHRAAEGSQLSGQAIS